MSKVSRRTGSGSGDPTERLQSWTAALATALLHGLLVLLVMLAPPITVTPPQEGGAAGSRLQVTYIDETLRPPSPAPVPPPPPEPRHPGAVAKGGAANGRRDAGPVRAHTILDRRVRESVAARAARGAGDAGPADHRDPATGRRGRRQPPAGDLHRRNAPAAVTRARATPSPGTGAQASRAHCPGQPRPDHAGRAGRRFHGAPGGRHPGHFTRAARRRSEEHTSELQSLMRTSYAVFCLKKKKN